MLLLEWIEEYALEHDIEPSSVEQFEITVRRFSRHLGRAADIADLQRRPVNQWLKAMQDAGLSRETVRSKRRSLLTLWRAAYGANPRRTRERPEGIRQIKQVQQNPECWTHEQLHSLLAECDKLQGNFRKLALPRRLYFRSLVNAKYDTALRLGDLLSVEHGWIWPGGFLSIVQHKTGRCHRAQLRDSTLAEIDQLMSVLPNRRLIWPEFSGRRRFYRSLKAIVNRAGLRGSSKWIRRSSASYYEREHPGEAWRHLGHASPGLDRRAYIDPRIAYSQPHLPPRIA